jgi:hypothetical protein
MSLTGIDFNVLAVKASKAQSYQGILLFCGIVNETSQDN